jgi:pimeloyl-ACP methyl ester carboxylesterase
VVHDVTIIEPESPRYRADLLLLHGLWTGPELWTAAAGGFAHRGWRCLLFDGRPASGSQPAGSGDRSVTSLDTLSAWCDLAAKVARRATTPLVAVGHDAGGLVALSLAERGLVEAAVAIAPLVEGTRRLVPASRRWRARLTRQPLSPPDLANPLFANEPPEVRQALAAQLHSEPLGRVLLDDPAAMPGRPRVPALLVAQQADVAISPTAIEITARGIEADFELLPGGHWPMLGTASDAWASRIHRWIIRQKGSALLLLRGDEDLSEL